MLIFKCISESEKERKRARKREREKGGRNIVHIMHRYLRARTCVLRAVLSGSRRTNSYANLESPARDLPLIVVALVQSPTRKPTLPPPCPCLILRRGSPLFCKTKALVSRLARELTHARSLVIASAATRAVVIVQLFQFSPR